MPIEQGGPSPEEMGIQPEQTDIEQPDKEPRSDYLPELGISYGVGDVAVVHRSSGLVESDWKISSFGEKSVIVRKTDEAGAEIQKVVPREEFTKWQKESPQFRYARKIQPHQKSRLPSDDEIRRMLGH